jgi:hypothetical protein
MAGDVLEKSGVRTISPDAAQVRRSQCLPSSFRRHHQGRCSRPNRSSACCRFDRPLWRPLSRPRRRGRASGRRLVAEPDRGRIPRQGHDRGPVSLAGVCRRAGGARPGNQPKPDPCRRLCADSCVAVKRTGPGAGRAFCRYGPSHENPSSPCLRCRRHRCPRRANFCGAGRGAIARRNGLAGCRRAVPDRQARAAGTRTG